MKRRLTAYAVTGHDEFAFLNDRRPDALIDEDDESLFLVANENGEATVGHSYRTEVHFDNGPTHTASLYSPSRQNQDCRSHLEPMQFALFA